MLPKPWVLREATLRDIDVIVHLRVECLKELGMARCPAEFNLMLQKNKAYFQEAIPKQDTFVWLIEKDKMVACTGAVSIFHGPPLSQEMQGDEAYIYNVYTIPDFRGKGLATEMMRHALEEMKKKKIPYVWLRTSKQGKGIYEKLGFASQPKTMDKFLISKASLCD